MSSRIILTNHARQRLAERQLSPNWVEQTVQQSDQRRHGRQAGTTEFVRRFGTSQVTVVANQNDRQEWIVVSAWIDPPVAGTKDSRKKQRYQIYRQSPWWKKFLLLAAKQLGIWEF